MTANIYKSKLDKIIKTDLLKEIDYGKFELHSFEQVKKISPFLKNLSQEMILDFQKVKIQKMC